MTILRSGSTKQYSDNWGSAFGTKRSKPKKAKASVKKLTKSAKKPVKKAKVKKK